MNHSKAGMRERKGTGHLVAKLCILSVKHHNTLITAIWQYMWVASTTILYLSLVGKLEMELALSIIGFGGLSIVALLWGLIETRRICLKDIQDPDLKDKAYQVMLDLISIKGYDPRNGFLKKRQKIQ
ncbi:hypothetical protein QUF76_08500 [Desulfobacterales bacterium HSG16]|nr:hypothetical protein [Desulfobacterales bacterium HSG16]